MAKTCLAQCKKPNSNSKGVQSFLRNFRLSSTAVPEKQKLYRAMMSGFLHYLNNEKITDVELVVRNCENTEYIFAAWSVIQFGYKFDSKINNDPKKYTRFLNNVKIEDLFFGKETELNDVTKIPPTLNGFKVRSTKNQTSSNITTVLTGKSHINTFCQRTGVTGNYCTKTTVWAIEKKFWNSGDDVPYTYSGGDKEKVTAKGKLLKNWGSLSPFVKYNQRLSRFKLKSSGKAGTSMTAHFTVYDKTWAKDYKYFQSNQKKMWDGIMVNTWQQQAYMNKENKLKQPDLIEPSCKEFTISIPNFNLVDMSQNLSDAYKVATDMKTTMKYSWFNMVGTQKQNNDNVYDNVMVDLPLSPSSSTAKYFAKYLKTYTPAFMYPLCCTISGKNNYARLCKHAPASCDAGVAKFCKLKANADAQPEFCGCYGNINPKRKALFDKIKDTTKGVIEQCFMEKCMPGKSYQPSSMRCSYSSICEQYLRFKNTDGSLDTGDVRMRMNCEKSECTGSSGKPISESCFQDEGSACDCEWKPPSAVNRCPTKGTLAYTATNRPKTMTLIPHILSDVGKEKCPGNCEVPCVYEPVWVLKPEGDRNQTESLDKCVLVCDVVPMPGSDPANKTPTESYETAKKRLCIGNNLNVPCPTKARDCKGSWSRWLPSTCAMRKDARYNISTKGQTACSCDDTEAWKAHNETTCKAKKGCKWDEPCNMKSEYKYLGYTDDKKLFCYAKKGTNNFGTGAKKCNIISDKSAPKGYTFGCDDKSPYCDAPNIPAGQMYPNFDYNAYNMYSGGTFDESEDPNYGYVPYEFKTHNVELQALDGGAECRLEVWTTEKNTHKTHGYMYLTGNKSKFTKGMAVQTRPALMGAKRAKCEKSDDASCRFQLPHGMDGTIEIVKPTTDPNSRQYYTNDCVDSVADAKCRTTSPHFKSTYKKTVSGVGTNTCPTMPSIALGAFETDKTEPKNFGKYSWEVHLDDCPTLCTYTDTYPDTKECKYTDYCKEAGIKDEYDVGCYRKVFAKTKNQKDINCRENKPADEVVECKIGKMPKWEIWAIVGASVLGAAILGIIIYFIVKHFKNKKIQKTSPQPIEMSQL